MLDSNGSFDNPFFQDKKIVKIDCKWKGQEYSKDAFGFTHAEYVCSFILKENPEAEIVLVPIVRKNKKSTVLDMIEGIELLIEEQVDIINMSMPNMLSGGQQQRVAIARALITKPAIILADEPTGNLDSRTSQDVLELIQNTSRRFEQTVVMITHNEHIAGLTERIVQIEDGKFLRTGADRNEKYSK